MRGTRIERAKSSGTLPVPSLGVLLDSLFRCLPLTLQVAMLPYFFRPALMQGTSPRHLNRRIPRRAVKMLIDKMQLHCLLLMDLIIIPPTACKAGSRARRDQRLLAVG